MKPVPAVQQFDTAPLAATEFTYNVEPERFVFDFKSFTPQFSPGGSEAHLMVVHKVVTLDPLLAKNLAEQLSRAVSDYEKQFGAIKQSEAITKAQKMAQDTPRTTTVERPSYMG